MPVENERKYVLDDPPGALERHLGDAGWVAACDVLQAYLDRDTRLRIFRPLPVLHRCVQPFAFAGKDAAAGAPTAGDMPVFSYKRKVAGRQIEIKRAA